MKMLVLNDSHIRGKNSANRKGDMFKDMLSKLSETVAISQRCDFVVHLGDLFDSHSVSNTVIDDVVDMVEEGGKKWYVTWGNHDQICGSVETSKASSLKHIFRRSEMFEHLSLIKNENTYIKGHDYYFEIEKDIKENGLMHNKKNKFTIATTHAFISIKPFHPDVLHVQAKDVKTNYDIVLCSHFHSVFDEVINGTRFINLGAWGRLSISEHKHTPKVAIIDTKTKEIEIIDLTMAKPGKDVFDLEKVAEDKLFNKNLDEFISSLQNVKVKGLETKTVVSNACEELKVDKKVKDLLISTIEEAEK